MNERLKDTLHRWLPKLAILSVLVLLTSFLINEYYVAPRYDAAAKEDRDKRHHHVQEYKQKEEAKGSRAQSRPRADRGPHRYTRR